MTRKLKVLGLAFVAVLALSAVAASAASAANKHLFDVGVAPAVVTGNQDTPNIFNAGANVECTTAKFEGTVAKTEGNKEVTVTPTYSGCKFNEKAATVRTNHCAYILTGDTNASGDAPVHVQCAAGSEIEVEIPSICTIGIGETTPQGGVHYFDTTNEKTLKKEITIEATVTNIPVKKLTTGIGCLFVSKEGTYKGSVTAGAFEDTGVPLEGTAKTTPGYSDNEKAQTDLTLTTNAE